MVLDVSFLLIFSMSFLLKFFLNIFEGKCSLNIFPTFSRSFVSVSDIKVYVDYIRCHNNF